MVDRKKEIYQMVDTLNGIHQMVDIIVVGFMCCWRMN